jgi:hypothetical protein
MKLTLRKISDYAACYLSHDSMSIDFNLLSNKEAKQLLEEFKDAVETLEWFVMTTNTD